MMFWKCSIADVATTDGVAASGIHYCFLQIMHLKIIWHMYTIPEIEQLLEAR
jgi:hypothetical protein